MIRVTDFYIPEETIDRILLVWQISRTEMPIGILRQDLRRMTSSDKEKKASEILSQDLPVREFVPISFIIEDAPRSFVDQLDRHRNLSFWEQSLRVRDLSKGFDYYVPPQLDDKPVLRERYIMFMEKAREVYSELAEFIPREQARGVIPLHINVRLSAMGNLRSVLHVVSSRTCFYSQGDYWRPVVNELVDGIYRMFPSLRGKIISLPCTGKNICPFEKDVMDRIDDKSNPVCPILISRFSKDKDSLLAKMRERYVDYDEISQRYLSSVGTGVI